MTKFTMSNQPNPLSFTARHLIMVSNHNVYTLNYLFFTFYLLVVYIQCTLIISRSVSMVLDNAIEVGMDGGCRGL